MAVVLNSLGSSTYLVPSPILVSLTLYDNTVYYTLLI